jgi:hypothetical protein
MPKAVREHENITTMESRGIDRQVLTNRTDIIIENKTVKRCLLIDVVITLDRNIIQKDAENTLKCKKYKHGNAVDVEKEMIRHTSNHWGH